MKHRTEGHTETTISGDTRADWSDVFEMVQSIQVAYVWHASVYTREVLDGLERLGFLYPQQIIWDKTLAAPDAGPSTGISTSRAGSSGSPTRRGTGRRARTPRSGPRRLPSS